MPPRWAPAAVSNSGRTQGILKVPGPPVAPVGMCPPWGGARQEHREVSVTFPWRRALENRSRNQAHPLSNPVGLTPEVITCRARSPSTGCTPAFHPGLGWTREPDFLTSSQVILRTAALTWHVTGALIRWRGICGWGDPVTGGDGRQGRLLGPKGLWTPGLTVRYPGCCENNKSVCHHWGIPQGSAPGIWR